jgi:hypothetical protein
MALRRGIGLVAGQLAAAVPLLETLSGLPGSGTASAGLCLNASSRYVAGAVRRAGR